MGHFGDHPLMQTCSNDHKRKLCRMLSTNAAKCARIDKMRTSLDGRKGEAIKQEMEKRLEKIQDNRQAKLIKPLSLPDGTMKRKRGGKRLRSMK